MVMVIQWPPFTMKTISLGTVLMIIGIVFEVLIVGLGVLAVVMAKKKAPEAETSEETLVDEITSEDAE